MNASDPDESRASREIDRLIGRLLQGGGLVAAALFALGLGIYLWRHPHTPLLAAVAANPVASYLSPAGLYHGAVTGHAQPIIVLGLLVLVATIVLRVAINAVYFARRGEGGSAWVGAVVTALLLVGMLVIGPLVR